MNNIPRLVGDELKSAADGSSIEDKKKVILIAENYDNKDNNRELQRIFPNEFPSWIKQVILSNNVPTQGDHAAENGDTIPVGAVWICHQEPKGELDLPYRMWVLVSNNNSVAVWEEISTATYVDNHKSSAAQVFDMEDLETYGAEGDPSENALLGYVPNAGVQVRIGSATERISKTNWFVRLFKTDYGGKKRIQILATKAGDASYQIQRVFPGNPEAAEWTWGPWLKMEPSSRTIGEVYFSQSSSTADNPGALPLFTGELIDKETYPTFSAWLGEERNKGLRVNNLTDYNNILETYGECPYYAWNVPVESTDPVTHETVTKYYIKLPILKNYIKMANTAEGITQAKAGLPNITGTAGVQPGLDSTLYRSGAFYTSSYNVRVDSGSSSSWSYANLAFDANKSNPIYGNSTTVTPAHTTLYPWVFAYSTLINSSALDLNKVQEQLSSQINTELTQIEENLTQEVRNTRSIPDYDNGTTADFKNNEWTQVSQNQAGWLVVKVTTNYPSLGWQAAVVTNITCMISRYADDIPEHNHIVGVYDWYSNVVNAVSQTLQRSASGLTFSFPIPAGWYFKCTGMTGGTENHRNDTGNPDTAYGTYYFYPYS